MPEKQSLEGEVWEQVIVGDDTGLLKLVALREGEEGKVLKVLGSQGKGVLEILPTVSDMVIVIRQFSVELWNWKEGSMIKSVEFSESILCGIKGQKLRVITKCGKLFDFGSWEADDSSTKPEGIPLPVSGEIVSVASCEDGLYLAIKGIPNPVLISEKNGKFEQVWTGKNQPDTKLGLKAKFEIKSMIASSPLLIAGDSEGRVRVYNSGLQRKCVSEISNVFSAVSNQYAASDSSVRLRPVTFMCSLVDKKRVALGDTMGSVVVLDLESKKVAHGFRGVMGSVRALAVSHNSDVLYAVSAGRFLYRFKTTENRTLPTKVFLKQKLTAVCVLPDVLLEQQTKRAKIEEEEDEGLGGQLTGDEEDDEDGSAVENSEDDEEELDSDDIDSDE